MITLHWFACAPDPEPPPPPASTPTSGWIGVDDEPYDWVLDAPFPVGPYQCAPARERDFADWPGGAKMRLEVSPFTFGAPLDVTVSGAEPGERVELYAGALCALDCPQPDGGCFQPADAALLATLTADADGAATATVVPPDELVGAWVVVQATAPDAERRYVSQPLIDHAGPEPGPPTPTALLRASGPATVRGLTAGLDGRSEIWSWTVPAGRRAQLTVDFDHNPYFKGNYNGAWLTTDGVTTDLGRPEADTAYTASPPTASRWTLTMGGTPDPYGYALDFALLPLEAPAPWYADADGDGYGDPDHPVATSSTPVDGASADGSDCDDTDDGVRPWAPERCDDGVDQDCDGADRPCVGDRGATGTEVRGSAYDGLGSTVAAADLDGDGVDEVLAGASPWLTGSGGTARVGDRTDAEGAAVTRWPPARWSSTGEGHDSNDDGLPELWVIRDSALVAYVDDRPVRSFTPSFDTLGVWVVGVAAADVTGDGATDLLVSATTGATVTTTVFEDPLGAATPTDVLTTSSEPGLAADLDGDGIGDWVDSVGCVWSGPTPFVEPRWCAPLSYPAAGDADGDGRLDLVGAAGREVWVYTAAGTDPWAKIETTIPSTAVEWLADHDAAGRPWIAAVGEHAAFAAPLLGPGGWSADGQLRLDSTAVAGGDFDGDGAVDLAVGRPSDGHGAEFGAGAVWIRWSALDAAP